MNYQIRTNAVMGVMCLVLAFRAWAGDGVDSATVTLHPTFENMGVEVRHLGDNNFNATGDVFYRVKGQGVWKQGHPLVMVGDTMVDPKTGATTNPRFYTSLFRLQEGTAYEVKVELKDPDGVAKQPEVITANTRNSKVPTGSGKHRYANPAAAGGGDGSKAKPFNTLEAAFKGAGPGDTIHLAKGFYHVYSALTSPMSGTDAAWVHILGEPGAVITDADPKVSGPGKLTWEPVQKDVDGRQIYKLALPNVHRIMVRKTPGDPATATPLWKFTDTKIEERFPGPHRGIELRDMVENYTAMNDLGVYLLQPDCVYLIPPKGMDDTAKIDLQVSRQDPTWDPKYPVTKIILAHHILIEGVTFEHSLNLRATSHLILRRVRGFLHDPRISLGDYSLVEDSIFVHNAATGWELAPPARTDRGNEFWDSWHRLKNGINDTHLMTPGKSAVIRYNHIHGFGNVIQYPDDKKNFNIDVYRNLIEFAGDDCVEPDGPGINWRVYENRFHNFLNGLSDSPISTGPFFVVRNIFQDYCQSAFKIRNKAKGKTLYYHNVTCPQRDPLTYAGTKTNGPRPATWPIPEAERPYEGFAFAPDEGGDVWMRTRNNILIGGDRPYKYHRKDKRPPVESYDFDFDALGWMQDGAQKSFKQVGGTHAVMLKSPFDLAGFKDYKGGDLRLSPGVAASLTDAGEIVKGINDGGPEAWQYKGKAPDIGLVEAGEALPHYGPRPAASNDKEIGQ